MICLKNHRALLEVRENSVLHTSLKVLLLNLLDLFILFKLLNMGLGLNFPIAS